MYAAFENITTVTKTRTNGRLFLDDPAKKDGVFERYVSVILEGTMEVVTRPQALTVYGDVGPIHLLPWDVINMPGEGISDLGKITADGNPSLKSTGVIRQNVGGQQYPATLDASVFQIFDIPGYGKLHNKYPVIVMGTVDSIPPFHTEAACRCALLFDENDLPRGIIGGRSLTILGPV